MAKSFSTASLAVGLTRNGKKVLVIDNDPQGHALKCLGIQKLKKPITTIHTMMNKIIHDEEFEKNEGIILTEEKVAILPVDIGYAVMELELISSMNRERIMKEYLDQIKEDYDYILIDCPPNLGLLVLNALTAADSVLIPVMTEDLSIDSRRYFSCGS